METGPDGRKRIDLTLLPRWAQWLIAGATVVVVVAVALLAGDPHAGSALPVSAIVAALTAFGFVAWRAGRRR